MDIIRTEGEIAGLKAQKDPDALAVAKLQLLKDNKVATDEAIKQQAYNNAMAQYGTGSDFQTAAQAVTGLLQGLAGDNLAGALGNASSPYLATLIKQQVGEENIAANAMAHAVLGAVVAELNNQSAVAGGLGAGGGELSARIIMDKLFPGKKVSDLTESEKQQVSALSQLAAGLAGGLSTGDAAGAVTAAQAGKNAVENNLMGGTEEEQLKLARSHAKDVMSCVDNPSGEACLRGEAVNKAIAIALVGGAAGGAVAAITPEALAAAQVAMRTCAANPALCTVEVSNFIVETIGAEAAPAGIAVTGAGYGVKYSTEQLVEFAALQAIKKEGGEVTPEMVNKVITGNVSKEIPKIINEQKTIEIKSGSKGDWNKQLNKPEPNTIYQVDGNKTYKTDSQGRVETVEAKLSLNSNDRNTYQQCKVGKCGVAGDEGGHLIATIFTGPGEKLNIVPMNSNLNRSEWKKMENSWAKALKENKDVDVKIEPVYLGNSDRPSSFNEIGSLLYGIAPDDAQKIIMRASLSDESDTCEYEYDYIDNENTLKWLTAGGGANTNMLHNLVELQNYYIENNLTNGLPVWKSCEATLDLEKMQINIHFKYED